MTRKNWKLEPKIKAEWSKDFFLITPAIVYYPWKYRCPGFPAVSMGWLGFYVDFGKWTRKR